MGNMSRPRCFHLAIIIQESLVQLGKRDHSCLDVLAGFQSGLWSLEFVFKRYRDGDQLHVGVGHP